MGTKRKHFRKFPRKQKGNISGSAFGDKKVTFQWVKATPVEAGPNK